MYTVHVCRLLRKLAPLLTAKFAKALCIMYCEKVISNNVEEEISLCCIVQCSEVRN